MFRPLRIQNSLSMCLIERVLVYFQVRFSQRLEFFWIETDCGESRMIFCLWRVSVRKLCFLKSPQNQIDNTRVEISSSYLSTTVQTTFRQMSWSFPDVVRWGYNWWSTGFKGKCHLSFTTFIRWLCCTIVNHLFLVLK